MIRSDRIIHVQTFALGEWMTNCYVLAHSQTPGSPCLIVDAGFEPQPLIDFIRQKQWKPQQVVLTHAHLDHIAGLHVLRGAWPDLPILVHKEEQDYLTEPMLNLSAMIDEPIIAPEPTGLLEQGQRLELDGQTFEVRHTPGHSPGGIALYQPQAGIALVGDALFAGSVGRSDFPTSDGQILFHSIQRQLLSLPDATKVYPGHGPATTIGQERQSNPYLQQG